MGKVAKTIMFIRYNICLVKRGNEILLLNREAPSWMGCWNGVGGKLAPGERPRASMIRELQEETGILDCELKFKGVMTWAVDGIKTGGMYTYLAEMPEDFEYPTPVKTREGILDWKSIDWILHKENRGIAAGIPKSLHLMLQDEACYEYRCEYKEGQLVRFSLVKIDPAVEENEVLRDALFQPEHMV
jgi:8-oxo-dGTP diphosphatase